EIGRRAEQDIGQRVGLVGEAPAFQALRAALQVAALEREGFVRCEGALDVHGGFSVRSGRWLRWYPPVAASWCRHIFGPAEVNGRFVVAEWRDPFRAADPAAGAGFEFV